MEGKVSAILNILITTFAVVTLHDVQLWLTVIATIGSITTAFFACRYYYFKTKK
jgi:phosphatidylglycerophosphate synthase